MFFTRLKAGMGRVGSPICTITLIIVKLSSLFGVILRLLAMAPDRRREFRNLEMWRAKITWELTCHVDAQFELSAVAAAALRGNYADDGSIQFYVGVSFAVFIESRIRSFIL